MKIHDHLKLFCVALSLLGLTTLHAQVKMPALFSDNMVLQQQTNVPIWGTAKPNSEITIKPSWDKNEYKTTADTAGKWQMKIKTPQAGGPFEIQITDGTTLTLKNVMSGEVWICSGQSNMEMPLAGWGKVQNYEQEIADANYPNIRLMQVEKANNFNPQSDIKGTWKECSPSSIADFSAVAYFFGRSLYKDLNIPIGLIHTSWGGTVAEAWTSAESLVTMPYFTKTVNEIEKIPQTEIEQKVYFTNKKDHWDSEVQSKDFGYKDNKPIATAVAYDDSGWKEMKVPCYWESNGLPNFDGYVWFRKTITIPQNAVNKELILNLGSIDDNDITFFNGVEVGRTNDVSISRKYTIPAHLVKKGKAVIAVRVLDTGGLGGLHDKMSFAVVGKENTTTTDLAGNWKYKVAMALSDLPSQNLAPNNPNNPTVLYNAMIHPLVPFAIKGAIWYQGESNADRAYQYRELFPLMINDWRKQWGSNFPFYFVQLANFQPVEPEPTSSNWAELREAQLKTLNLQNTGMAVSIDLGMADNIHPKDKQDVGARLALIAKAKTYGENVAYSGPIYQSYRQEGNAIRIFFDHIEGGLKSKGEVLQGFAIAGVDHKFYWANAVINNDNTIVVSSPNVPEPIAVRYAWASNPICNLYNSVNLPASPFRTDDWLETTATKQ